jgi:nucleoside-diphosphate-sugar epimerase
VKPPNKVLVTGADGCVGGAIAEQLRSSGYEVHGLVYGRDPIDERESWLDLRDPAALSSLDGGPFDVVFHAAANVDPTVPAKTMFDINLGGTTNVLRWAKQQGCSHFVQISSVSVYGTKATGADRREASTGRSRYIGLPYSRSKAAAEAEVEQSGIPYTILRLPMVIGKGDCMASPTFIDAIRDGSFFMPGSGKKLCSLMTVPNIGPFAERVLRRGPSGCALNCADHHVPWREIAQQYADEMAADLPGKRLSWPKGFFSGRASNWLLMWTSGKAGGHFPTDELEFHLGPMRKIRWQRAVADAVSNYRD